MPVSVGTAYVDIRPDMSGFGRELNSGVTDPARDTGRRAGGAMAGSFKKAAGAIGAAFAGVQVAGFLKDAVGAASDLEESISKVGVVFGDQAGTIEAFAKSSATNLGISRQAALEATGTLGNLFVAMGLGEEETADLSTSMVTLASDLASFNNASPEETLNALRSGLLGETEPLKRFGVNLNAARIEAEAFALGLAKPAKNAALIEEAGLKVEDATRAAAEAEREFGEDSDQAIKARAALAKAEESLAKATAGSKVELTAAQKAQAAYSLIMKDTETAQGDFARTSDGLANKQRILAAQFEDIKSRVGSALLPVVLRITTFLSDNLIPAFSRVGEVLRPLGGVISEVASFFRGGTDSMGESGSKLQGTVAAISGAFSSAFEAIGAVISTFVTVATELWDRFGSTLIDYVTEAWASIQEIFRGAFNVLSGVFDLIKAIFTGKWGEAWEAIKQILDGAWDTIFGVIRGAVTNVIPTIFSLGKQALLAAFGLLWNGFKTVVDDAWDTIFEAVRTGLGKVTGFIEDLPGQFAEAGKGAWDWLWDTFKEIWNKVAGFIRDLDFTIDVPDILPGPDEYTIGFPDLPLLADGGRVTRSGLGIVGDAGPELLELPRGAQVAPLELASHLEPPASRAEASGPLVGEINLNGSSVTATDVADELSWLMRTMGR